MTEKVLNRIITAVLCAALVLSAFAAVPDTASAETKKKHTVMVYMCGSNLEEESNSASGDISDMMRTRFNTDEINVVLILGGSRRWAQKYDTGKLTLLQLQGRKAVVIDQMPLSGMCEAVTLTNFLNYCYANFPAEHYELIMWDHGGGPNGGVCQDTLFYGDTLSMGEMVEALNASPFANKGLEWIAFDACLMGSAEVAANLAPFARYMIATEDSQFGLDSSYLKGMENDADALTTAMRMVDATYEKNKQIADRQNSDVITSVMVMDLSKTDKLIEAVDAYFEGVIPQTVDVNFTAMSRQRSDTTAFGMGDSGNQSCFDLVDLGDLVERYEQLGYGDATAVREAVSELVVYYVAENDACSGATVYHPYFNKNKIEKLMTTYSTLGFSESYLHYLQQFSAILTGTPLAKWTDLETGSYAQRDSRVQFNLRLTEEQVENTISASLVILHKAVNGGYNATYTTPKTVLTGENVLNGEFAGTALYIVDANGDIISDTLEYSVDNSGRYLVRAFASGVTPDVTFSDDEFEIETGSEAAAELSGFTQQVLLVCTADAEDAKLLNVSGVKVYDEITGGYTTAFNTGVEDYTAFTFTVESREETYDSEGVLLPFDSWNTVAGTDYTVNAADAWTLRLVNDTIDTAELYAAFAVTDSQCSTHMSSLHRIKTQNTADEEFWSYDDLEMLLIENGMCTVNGGSVFISAGVTNLLETEAYIALENLTVNGAPVEAEAFVFGNGTDWGLLRDETQLLSCMLTPEMLSGIDAITEIRFDLVLYAAADETALGTVPVVVNTMLNVAAAN